MKTLKQMEKYFAKHVWYGHLIHVMTGIGIGIIVSGPFAGEHPVRWGVAFLAVGILGHVAAWMDK